MENDYYVPESDDRQAAELGLEELESCQKERVLVSLCQDLNTVCKEYGIKTVAKAITDYDPVLAALLAARFDQFTSESFSR